MSQNVSQSSQTSRQGHGFKPVAIPAVIAAVQMANAKAPQARRVELPAILRKEAQLG